MTTTVDVYGDLVAAGVSPDDAANETGVSPVDLGPPCRPSALPDRRHRLRLLDRVRTGASLAEAARLENVSLPVLGHLVAATTFAGDLRNTLRPSGRDFAEELAAAGVSVFLPGRSS